MSQLFTGSICLTDLIMLAKQSYPAFSKAQNGKIYVQCSLWMNDTPDTFGNHAALQTYAKDEPKHYVGNFKLADRAVTADDLLGADDLPQ